MVRNQKQWNKIKDGHYSVRPNVRQPQVLQHQRHEVKKSDVNVSTCAENY